MTNENNTWKELTQSFSGNLHNTLPDHKLDRYAVSSNGGISRSIGLDWAMPDDMVDEPYYYLSFWSEDPVENFKAHRTWRPENGSGDKWP